MAYYNSTFVGTLGVDNVKKAVIVRKKQAQRYGILAVYLAMICLSVLLGILLFPIYYYGLLALVGTLPILYVLIYYQMWSISFSENHITIKCFLRKSKTYTYFQIADGRVSNSYTLHRHVFLRFSDNRSCWFRLEDENAKTALKIIQTHYSLRNAEWFNS